ncbi:hypothetical protein ACFE04_029048 [Oxalis oulophora]
MRLPSPRIQLLPGTMISSTICVALATLAFFAIESSTSGLVSLSWECFLHEKPWSDARVRFGHPIMKKQDPHEGYIWLTYFSTCLKISKLDPCHPLKFKEEVLVHFLDSCPILRNKAMMFSRLCSLIVSYLLTTRSCPRSNSRRAQRMAKNRTENFLCSSTSHQ